MREDKLGDLSMKLSVDILQLTKELREKREIVILLPLPKNPSHLTWIFSFVPLGTTSFAWHTQHHFEQSENIIAVSRGTNERC